MPLGTHASLQTGAAQLVAAAASAVPQRQAEASHSAQPASAGALSSPQPAERAIAISSVTPATRLTAPTYHAARTLLVRAEEQEPENDDERERHAGDPQD